MHWINPLTGSLLFHYPPHALVFFLIFPIVWLAQKNQPLISKAK